MNKFQVRSIEAKVEEFFKFQRDITPKQYEYCLKLVNRECPHFNVILSLQDARNMFEFAEYVEERLKGRHGIFPLANSTYEHGRRYICMARKFVEERELHKRNVILFDEFKKEYLKDKSVKLGDLITMVDKEPYFSELQGKRSINMLGDQEEISSNEGKGMDVLDSFDFEDYPQPSMEDLTLEDEEFIFNFLEEKMSNEVEKESTSEVGYVYKMDIKMDDGPTKEEHEIDHLEMNYILKLASCYLIGMTMGRRPIVQPQPPCTKYHFMGIENENEDDFLDAFVKDERTLNEEMINQLERELKFIKERLPALWQRMHIK